MIHMHNAVYAYESLRDLRGHNYLLREVGRTFGACFLSTYSRVMTVDLFEEQVFSYFFLKTPEYDLVRSIVDGR